MYPVTNAVKALFDAENAQVLRITGTDKNNVSISITDADVMQNGFTIDRYCCNGDKLEIGTAVAAEMTLRLNNSDGKFDDIIFEGTELTVEVGIADWTQNSPTVSWVPCGVFIPDEQPRALSTITIHALDRMMYFDKELPTLQFPMFAYSLVAAIAGHCGVPFTQTISNLPNYTCVIQGLPELQQTITCRSLIQWCAGIMGTNAWIDWTGSLCFSWYSNSTGYITTTANRYSSDIYENPITITGVRYKDSDENQTVYLAGTDNYAIDVSDNRLINASNANTVLTGIYSVVHDCVYTPFTASVVNAPYLWPMDQVTFTDKDGGNHASLLTNVQFVLNGNTDISAKGETSANNARVQPSDFTSWQNQQLEHIQRVNSGALSAAVEHATQMITGGLGGYVVMNINPTTGYTEEILIMDTPDKQTAVNVWRFNQNGLGHSSNGYNGPYNDVALTSDGQINANMITSGVMNADIIRTGTITSPVGGSYWDLDTGVLMISGVSATEIADNIGQSVTGLDIEYAQSQSSSIAPTTGWSTVAPSWAAGWYIWQRVKTTTPDGVEYSEATCISGRDGAGVTDGLNQATLYLYQRNGTQPLAPSVSMTYTFADGSLTNIPSGWSRSIPSGTAPCWVTSAAAISSDTAITLAANAWQEPVMLAQSGAAVSGVVTYFALSDSIIPPATDQFNPLGTPVPWTDDENNVMTDDLGETIYFDVDEAPVPTADDPYVWSFQRSTYTDGTVLDSTKYISAIYGEQGVGVAQITEQYYLSTSDEEPTGGTWSDRQPVWVEGHYIWTRSRIQWTDDTVTTTDPVLARALNSANEKATEAASKADSAAAREQTIYRSAPSGTITMAGTTTWVGESGNTQDVWTTTRPVYASAYPVLFVALQRQTVEQRAAGSTCSCTTPAIDQTTTVIDGGHISTGTIDAGVVNVTNIRAENITSGYLNAARIEGGSLGIGKLASSVQNNINGAVASTVSIYWRATAHTTPSINTSMSIGTSVDTDNAWTYLMPRPKRGCYFYTCERYTKSDNSVSFSSVREIANASYTSLWCSESNSTYIDGGRIFANSITADQIAGGTITANELNSDVITSINNANGREQIIYKSAVPNTEEMAATETWVTNDAGGQLVWTTRRPQYNVNYPVLFVALQRQTVPQMRSGTTCSCTTPNIDRTTTVINGANIITGSVSTNQLDAEAVTAAKIAGGTITADRLETGLQTNITNGAAAYARDSACFGRCGTQASSTGSKFVYTANIPMENGDIKVGVSITVLFTQGNTYASGVLSLSINGSAYKSVYVGGAATSSTNVLLFPPNTSLTFVYDGAYWRLQDKPGSYRATEANNNAGTRAKTTTADGIVIFKGVTMTVPFTNENTAVRTQQEDVTLNVSSLGARGIRTATGNEVPTTANGKGWVGGSTVIFEFDGNVWRLNTNATIIDGGHILTGEIDASQVNVANINANNITSGSLSAGRVSTGTLTVGGTDNGDVVISVKDSNNAEFARFNNMGLSVGGIRSSQRVQAFLAGGGLYLGYSSTAVLPIEGYENPVSYSKANVTMVSGTGAQFENTVSNAQIDIMAQGTNTTDDYGTGKAGIRLRHLSSGNSSRVTIMADEFRINVGSNFKLTLYEGTTLPATTYTGKTGSFTTADGKTVYVRNGIITSIS